MNDKAIATSKRRRTTIETRSQPWKRFPFYRTRSGSELLASLKDAERRVKACKAIAYDSKTFKKRLLNVYRGVKR